MVPGNSFPCKSGRCAGHWEPGHRIYVAEDFAMNEMVVRHEMLHALLQRGSHPAGIFVEACHVASAAVWRDSSLTVDPGNPHGR